MIDLSGIVKALAIQAAGDILRGAALSNWCLNAGGDVLIDGHQRDGRPWQVGIADPTDRTTLLSVYAATPSACAVATSGYSERGDHIWRPTPPADRSADDPISFSQVTVVAEDIVTADVLATAILAGGPACLYHLEQLYSMDILAVGPNGLCWATQAFWA